MSLFDFFFPEQAQAAHLRRIADGQRTTRKRRRRETSKPSPAVERRIDELEDDLGYVTLILGSLLAKLDEKGVLAREDVRAVMAELDELDGVSDGKLDINVLKGMQN